jgi:hypothetical protein
MKDVFLVHITLPDFFSKKMYDLIPKQRELINDLLDKRVVLSYSLDMERKNLWVYIDAISEQEVMDILSTFPIIKEVKVNIHELAFFDRAPLSLPDLILN